jgi:hypothetical protein
MLIKNQFEFNQRLSESIDSSQKFSLRIELAVYIV